MELTKVISWQKLDNENDEQYDAFSEYLRLGHNRSLSKLQSKTSISLELIKYWFEKFNWEKRALDFDLIEADIFHEKLLDYQSLLLLKEFETTNSLMEKWQELNDSNDNVTMKQLKERIITLERITTLMRRTLNLPEKITQSNNTHKAIQLSLEDIKEIASDVENELNEE